MATEQAITQAAGVLQELFAELGITIVTWAIYDKMTIVTWLHNGEKYEVQRNDFPAALWAMIETMK